MSKDHGYIYVKNWEKRQHHKYEHPPWHKVYNSLLHDDAYLSLTAADRGLLHGLWMLASVCGQGRVSADSVSLRRQLGVRSVSLEPLIHAGFIQVLGTKRVRTRTTEKSREEREEEKEVDISTVSPTTSAPAPTTHGFEISLPNQLARILDAQIIADLKPDQRALVAAAWENHPFELRHSLAAVEAADNPVAMLVSVARRLEAA